MIPPNVRKTHLDQAIRRVRRDGVPPRRRGRAYELVVDGASLPPKYVLAVAIELATGTHPSSDSFGGGAETNDFLRSHGFTVVDKGAAIPAASTRLRVARVFLDLGVRQRAYRAHPDGKAKAFGQLSRALFDADPSAYVHRIRTLLEAAHEQGATVAALPACALQVSAQVDLDAYAVPALPFVVAGGATAAREFAVVVRHGVAGPRFDHTRVHWMQAGPGLSLMAAISSTIGQSIDSRFVPPVRSTTHPPRADTPVLVIDVGHAQYGARYEFHTLRCVARDVARRVGQPAAVVLSSWMWSTRGISAYWFHPHDRVTERRLQPSTGDHLDILDIDLTAPARSTIATP